MSVNVSPGIRPVALGGAAVALLYFLAASYVWPHVPVRILYEGSAPPLPYRWVRPPANLARDNQAPEAGTGTIALTPDGSASASILTNDAQAGVIFSRASIAPRPGATSARVRIAPLDPTSIAGPPAGARFDGNAYRVEATYATGEPAVLQKPVTPVLRYPVHATVLLRSTNTGWQPLDSRRVEEALQIFAQSDRLGAFVAAGPAAAASSSWAAYAAAAAGIIAAVTAFALAGRRGRARRIASGHR